MFYFPVTNGCSFTIISVNLHIVLSATRKALSVIGVAGLFPTTGSPVTPHHRPLVAANSIIICFELIREAFIWINFIVNGAVTGDLVKQFH